MGLRRSPLSPGTHCRGPADPPRAETAGAAGTSRPHGLGQPGRAGGNSQEGGRGVPAAPRHHSPGGQRAPPAVTAGTARRTRLQQPGSSREAAGKQPQGSRCLPAPTAGRAVGSLELRQPEQRGLAGPSGCASRRQPGQPGERARELPAVSRHPLPGRQRAPPAVRAGEQAGRAGEVRRSRNRIRRSRNSIPAADAAGPTGPAGPAKQGTESPAESPAGS